MLASYPHSLLDASGEAVGLPKGQMGNSEVGHMNLGAGRVVMQLLGRIEREVANGGLAANPRLVSFIEKTRAAGGAIHIWGLVSDGGVHSHIGHIIALARAVAPSGLQVWLHAVLDGRDTPPRSAAGYVSDLEAALRPFPNIQIATISGRYYAMDRNKTWERTKLAYDAMALARSSAKFSDALMAVESSYSNNVGDEFVVPAVAAGYPGMADGDGLLIANFRADRVRQIAAALADPAFDGFARSRVAAFADLLGMAEYSAELDTIYGALFPSEPLGRIFGEVVAEAGLTQLRIAETEKYAHVTFFFNGGEERRFPGEERILVPSPKVATYDLKPEMSAFEVTELIERAIAGDGFDVIIANYANGDMVGHTGILGAALKAAAAIDKCIARLERAVLAKSGAMIITADHGNCEQMLDNEGKPFTAHTSNPVEAVLVGRPDVAGLRPGRLADVAPTMLKILGLPKPAEMTGNELF